MPSNVNLETLSQYLERFGWKHYQTADEPAEQEGLIRTGWRASEGQTYRMVIDPMVEKNCLSFRVIQVAMAPWDSTPSDRLNGLLTLLNWVNYRIILGKFGYDASDGEVRFSIDVPIDENDFSYAQFEHTLHVIINSMREWDPQVQAVLCGETPVQDVLVSSARESGASEDFMRKLTEALERRGDWYAEGTPLTEI
ncbi:MAG: YbjN domain-containing protein [Chloroflexia bacterium]|nr:YbjN domain-containing protein [Chloroflexia bacterium]